MNIVDLVTATITTTRKPKVLIPEVRETDNDQDNLSGYLLGLWVLFMVGRFVYYVVDNYVLLPEYTPPPRLALLAPRGAEQQARASMINWFDTYHGLNRSALDPEFAERAYYLAGEAPRLFWNQGLAVGHFPAWPGYRYVVGPADGRWTRYWSGCRRFSQLYASDGTISGGWSAADCAAVAIHPYPGLAGAEHVGVAVVWRRTTAYIAVVWESTAVCPALPTPSTRSQPLEPTGPGM